MTKVVAQTTIKLIISQGVFKLSLILDVNKEIISTYLVKSSKVKNEITGFSITCWNYIVTKFLQNQFKNEMMLHIKTNISILIFFWYNEKKKDEKLSSAYF